MSAPLAWFINIVQAEEALRQAALSYGHLPVTNKYLDSVFSPSLLFWDTVITLKFFFLELVLLWGWLAGIYIQLSRRSVTICPNGPIMVRQAPRKKRNFFFFKDNLLG